MPAGSPAKLGDGWGAVLDGPGVAAVADDPRGIPISHHRQRNRQRIVVRDSGGPSRSQVTAGRWVIRDRVESQHQDEPEMTKMLELNSALEQMKRAFDPHLQQLDPRLQEGISEPSAD